MKSNFIKELFLPFMACLLSMPAWSATIWHPTWDWNETNKHVVAVDHSENCTSTVAGYPSLLMRGNNTFYYYMYSGKNTSSNPGSLNVAYYLTDAITLTAGEHYKLSFNLQTDWTYRYVTDSKVKLELVSGTDSEANLIQTIGMVDTYKNLGGSSETQSLDFDAATGGEVYLRMTLTGNMIGQIFVIKFSEFMVSDGTISKPAITQQPVSTVDLDISKPSAISVAATGDEVLYQWMYKTPGRVWQNVSGGTSATLQLPELAYAPQTDFKCVVSNAAGSVESETTHVNSVTLHGVECPVGSGTYYTTYYGSNGMSLDDNTTACIARFNSDNTALELVEVTDKYIKTYLVTKGLVLKSSQQDMVLSDPKLTTAYSNFSTNILTGQLYTHNAKSNYYVLSVVNNELRFMPTTEAQITHHTAYIISNTVYSDGLPLVWKSGIDLQQDADGYSLINNLDDWKTFCGYVNAGKGSPNAKLISDINSIDAMVGVDNAKFSGTFDGQGHTLSLAYTSYVPYTAPFSYVENATIRCVNTVGFVGMRANSGADMQSYSSTLVGAAEGNTHIEHCSSSAEITFSATDDVKCGGLVGLVNGGQLSISDCLFAGRVDHLTSNEQIAAFAGLVGWGKDATITIERCLLNTQRFEQITALNTFVRANNYDHVVVDKCFYFPENTNFNSVSGIDGTAATTENLASGEIMRQLQDNRTDESRWAQVLGSTPSFYDSANKTTENYIYFDTTEKAWYCDNLQIPETTALPQKAYFTARKISNARKLAANGLYTICLPYDIVIPQGVTAYRLTGIDTNEKVARFQTVSATSLNRGEPYLIQTGDEAMSLNVADKTFVSTDITSVVPGVNPTIEAFHGTFATIDNAEAAAAGAYILQSDGLFHKVTTDNTDATIPAYRAYITIADGSTASKAKALSIAFGDNTTGLRAIETTDQDGTVRYYDLHGRYIGNTLDGQSKGIYIKNGKKILKK